ncbi:ferredoxin-thioredoxin reductase variable chain, partial [Chroococcidiopsis sp.]
MKVGDRVRVKESVIVYHHPEHRNQPFDIKGLEGDVLGIV